VKSPFSLERYLTDLRDRTAWAPDFPIETLSDSIVPRPALYRIAHLWTLALLDARFDTLLLPVLVTAGPILEALEEESRTHSWTLSRDFFRERLESGACLLFLDGPAGAAADQWPRNRAFFAA
jgi:hypothetical protein